MTKQEQIAKAPAIEYIPLADLYLSDFNPRQEVDEAETAFLADSIATCGLIQNLSGLRDQDGKVEIVAGGRRLRALQLAVKLDPSLDPVPVILAPNSETARIWANVKTNIHANHVPFLNRHELLCHRPKYTRRKFGQWY